MFGEIAWTAESEDHIARHHVTPGEVEEGLFSRPRLVKTGRDSTTLVYCRTNAGRHLLVVTSEGVDGRDFVVTARDLTDAEKRAFRRRRR